MTHPDPVPTTRHHPLRDVLLDADQEARRHAAELTADARLPPGYIDDHYRLTRLEQRELRRLKACMAAAPDVEIFLALERGDAVPLRRLNPQTAAAHQRRRR